MSELQIPPRDGDGYLEDMNDWSEAVARAMAADDGIELDTARWGQVVKAREYYDSHSTVPPVRQFARYLGVDKRELFDLWMTGPMKPITKYGGLPKPTGCV
jgi:tRNA 2-thiouridine synthesizing protein E